jgi:hypothetical protein
VWLLLVSELYPVHGDCEAKGSFKLCRPGVKIRRSLDVALILLERM